LEREVPGRNGRSHGKLQLAVVPDALEGDHDDLAGGEIDVMEGL
jgi:hypothetical protein